MSLTASSISPVGRFGLTLPSSRRTTSPAARTTCSERSALGLRERLAAGVRVEDELDDARAVAQVDEDQAAVVAAAVHPAGDTRAGVPAWPSRSSPHQASRKWLGRGGLHSAWRPLSTPATTPARSDLLLLALNPCRAAPSRRGRGSQRIGHRARSACFIWPLTERPGQVELRRQPGAAGLGRQREGVGALGRLATRRTGRSRARAAGAPRRPAASARRRPPSRTPGVARAAELLDQPVVAPAAADARLGAERVGGELEDRARVVVQAAHERRSTARTRRRRASSRSVTCAKCSRVVVRRGGRAAAARPP